MVGRIPVLPAGSQGGLQALGARECPGRDGEESIFKSIVEILEIILAVFLASVIIIASARLANLIYLDLIKPEHLSKESILELLDIILLLVLSIDILRTLVTAVVRRQFPIRIVIEAAMLAVLREIISVEIRKLDYKMILSLAIVFLILAFVWLVVGVMERRGEVEEVMGV